MIGRTKAAALRLLALAWVGACGDPGSVAVPVETAVPPPAADSAAEGVCGRTPQVRDALVAATERTSCADVTAADLASIFWLDLQGFDDPDAGPKITTLASVDFRGLTSLGSLLLRNNQLDSLPPGVWSGLSRLNTLDLAENRLAALPDGTFEGLSELWTLSLAGNLLTEIPAGSFAGLGRLTWLDLALNQVRTLPAGLFDDLGELQHLQLSGNLLEELPEGLFDDARLLLDLQLAANRLTSWPAAALQDLSGLEFLWIGGNRLRTVPTGALESLPALRYLDLSQNSIQSLSRGSFRGTPGLDLLWLGGNPGAPFPLTVELERVASNPAAPGSAQIQATLAEGAPFALRVPLTVAGGSLSTTEAVIAAGHAASEEVGVTNAPGSSLTVTASPPSFPADSCLQHECFNGFELTTGNPLVLVNPRTAKVSVPAVHLIQSTQSLDGRVPLVAGRRALLRVFAISDSANTFRPTARVTFFLDGRAVHEASLEPPPGGIPTGVAQSRLARSFNATIPGSVLQPGVEMVVEVDPEGALPLAPGSVRRIPEEGRAELDVHRARPLELTVVPVQYAWDANAVANAGVAELARELATGRSDEQLRFAHTLLPVAEVNVEVREPYFTEADTADWGGIALLEEVQLLRHVEAGGTEKHYHGIFAVPRFVHRDGFWGFLGVAFQPGYSGLTLSHGRDGAVHPELGQTLAHELGHNLSLGHAPCGNPTGVDPEFPYQSASIGAWGFEFAGPSWPARLIDPARHVDLMSYCRPYWISDYNFAKAMRFRAERAPPASGGRPVRSLLLWGGVRDGRLRLAPALAWNALPKLPARPGSYRLAGLGAGGAELFSMSFEPDALDHGGGRSFLFAVPFQAGWEAALQGVALQGPEGIATMEIEASRRLAVFTDRGVAGQAPLRIRGISRDWEGSLPAGLQAAGDVDVRFGWPGRR